MPEPAGHPNQKLSEAARRIANIRFKQPFKFHQGLFIKDDTIKLFGVDSSGLQAMTHRVYRETIVVFFSGESLFLRSDYNPAVAHKGGGAIVVKR
jgi:hypothetical protein